MNPFRFLAAALSQGGSVPSSTRLALLLVVLTACSPLWAWSWRFAVHGTAADMPGGVVAACGLIVGIVATLKGWEANDIKKKEDKTE